MSSIRHDTEVTFRNLVKKHIPFLIRFMFLVRIAYSPNDIMITILREPVARYLSEWKHVTRGARLGFKRTALLTLLFCCGNILKARIFDFSVRIFPSHIKLAMLSFLYHF